MRKKIIFILISFGILTFAVYNYIYQDHRNIESEDVEFELQSADIIREFALTPENSSKRYLDKTVVVVGLLSEINLQNITLDNAVFCQFTDTISMTKKINDRIKIKGLFIGYDDLLEQVKLNQCSIID
jgi:hypothetical protein